MKLLNKLFFRLSILFFTILFPCFLQSMNFELGQNYTYYLEDEDRFIRENLLPSDIKEKIDEFFEQIGINFKELLSTIEPIALKWHEIGQMDEDELGIEDNPTIIKNGEVIKCSKQWKAKYIFLQEHKEYLDILEKDIKRKLKENGCKILKSDCRLVFSLPEFLGSYVFKINSPEGFLHFYFNDDNVGRVLNSIKINSSNFENVRAPKKYLYQVSEGVQLKDHNYFVVEEFVEINQEEMIITSLLYMSEDDFSDFLYSIRKTFVSDLGLTNGVNGANVILDTDNTIVFLDTPQSNKSELAIYPAAGESKELYVADFCFKNGDIQEKEIGQLIVDTIVTSKVALTQIIAGLMQIETALEENYIGYGLTEDQLKKLKDKIKIKYEIINRHVFEIIDDIKNLISRIKSFNPYEILEENSDKAFFEDELRERFTI